MGTAQAEVIVKNREAAGAGFPIGTYLGAYFPHDRGTFGNRLIALEIGQSIQFDNYWIFDVNDRFI